MANQPDRPDAADEGAYPTQDGLRVGWLQRRRDKIVAEIERNRRGEYTVPTWVLVVAVAAIVAAWITVIVVS